METLELLKDMCRSCLDNVGTISLYESDNHDLPFSQMLLLCASVQVLPEELSPQQICSVCVCRLRDAFLFRSQCQKSEARLRELHNFKYNVKIEDEKESKIGNEKVSSGDVDFYPELPFNEYKRDSLDELEIVARLKNDDNPLDDGNPLAGNNLGDSLNNLSSDVENALSGFDADDCFSDEDYVLKKKKTSKVKKKLSKKTKIHKTVVKKLKKIKKIKRIVPILKVEELIEDNLINEQTLEQIHENKEPEDKSRILVYQFKYVVPSEGKNTLEGEKTSKKVTKKILENSCLSETCKLTYEAVDKMTIDIIPSKIKTSEKNVASATIESLFTYRGASKNKAKTSETFNFNVAIDAACPKDVASIEYKVVGVIVLPKLFEKYTKDEILDFVHNGNIGRLVDNLGASVSEFVMEKMDYEWDEREEIIKKIKEHGQNLNEFVRFIIVDYGSHSYDGEKLDPLVSKVVYLKKILMYRKQYTEVKDDEEEDLPLDGDEDVLEKKKVNKKRKPYKGQYYRREMLCEICGGIFKYDTLTSHMRTHTGEKPFKCEICGRRFRARDAVRMHVARHKGIKYMCTVCGQALTSRVTLQKHMYTHTNARPVPCNLCGRAFKNREYLKTHERTHLVREKKFFCGLCDKGFAVKYHLNKHIQITHTSNSIPCSVCPRVFKTASYLKRHVQKVHEREGLREHKCPHCPKEYASQYSLRNHVLSHTGGKKTFECELCGENFSNKTGFNKHVILHKM